MGFLPSLIPLIHSTFGWTRTTHTFRERGQRALCDHCALRKLTINSTANRILWQSQRSPSPQISNMPSSQQLTKMNEPVTMTCQFSHNHEAWRVSRHHDEHSVATVRKSNRQVSHVSRNGTKLGLSRSVRLLLTVCSFPFFRTNSRSQVPNSNFRLCFLLFDWDPCKITQLQFQRECKLTDAAGCAYWNRNGQVFESHTLVCASISSSS